MKSSVRHITWAPLRCFNRKYCKKLQERRSDDHPSQPELRTSYHPSYYRSWPPSHFRKKEAGFSQVEASPCDEAQRCLSKPIKTSNPTLPNISLARIDVYPQDTFSPLDSISRSRSLVPLSLYAYEPLSTPLASTLPLSPVNKLLCNLSTYYRSPPQTPLAILAAKKKYKPVALKIRPVMTELPKRFCIT